jgi:hypothetical protein
MVRKLAVRTPHTEPFVGEGLPLAWQAPAGTLWPGQPA